MALKWTMTKAAGDLLMMGGAGLIVAALVVNPKDFPYAHLYTIFGWIAGLIGMLFRGYAEHKLTP